MATERKKGHFTFRTAAVFFFVTAVFELLGVGTPVPFFGELRGGAVTLVYHLVYAALFVALGAGLWGARPWGYTLVFAATTLYTLDRLQLLLSDAAMYAVVAQMHAEIGALMPGIEMALVSQALVLLLVLFVAGWWGFALYTRWRRDYFRNTGT